MWGMKMKCSRCGADTPPTNLYCGQCGRSLAEGTKLGRSIEAAGWLTMAAGLIALALTTAYFIIMTTLSLWSIGEPLYIAIQPVAYPISGQGFWWPGLTVGALLGVLGTAIHAWPRIQAPGPSGKGIRALVLIGSAIVLIGAIFGTFPQAFYGLYSGDSSPIVRGIYSINYQTLVLTGFTIILAGAVWSAWKGRSWRLPSTEIAANDTAAEGTDAHR
jgi:hypothetical protein